MKFIPLQITLCLILGIVAGFYFNSLLHISVYALPFLFVLLLAYFFIKKNKVDTSVFFSTITYLIFFFIGITSITFQNDLNVKNHYSTLSDSSKVVNTVLKIDKTLKPSLYYNKYWAKVLQINNQPSQGKILLNIVKDSASRQFSVGEKLLIKSAFKSVNLPKNPHQFNYREYLQKQNIYRQITINKNEFLPLNSTDISLYSLADHFRQKVNHSLKKYGFKNEELSMINALLLGQRKDVSKEIIENYSKAGAIHILAISGLHVGIILWLLSIILKPLEYLKNGKNIKLILAVILLWCFAFVAGLSASVVRAVSMFTAVAISYMGKKQSNVYQNLITSMFFLLLIHPYYLFDVGFQLSYLAVFFIVWLQPMLSKIWTPKLKLANYFWQIFTVSIAAQLGVLPLSLYYFHQFPGLFFITNLVIIPLLTVILGVGLLVIFLALINILPEVLAKSYQWIIASMNQFIEWVAQQESFLYQNISFSVLIMIALYLFIILSFRWIENKSFSRLKYALFALLLLQSAFIYEKWQTSSINKLIVFNKSRSTLIGRKSGSELTLFHNLDSLNIKDKIISSYLSGKSINDLRIVDSVNKSQLFKKDILLVDSLGVYQLNNFKSKSVILTQSPKINLERLIKTLDPKIIIADNSNFKSYVKRWKNSCVEYNIPFYYTNKSGAFTVTY